MLTAKNLNVCSNKLPTCCTRKMEKRYERKASMNITGTLEARISSLKSDLTNFHHNFLSTYLFSYYLTSRLRFLFFFEVVNFFSPILCTVWVIFFMSVSNLKYWIVWWAPCIAQSNLLSRKTIFYLSQWFPTFFRCDPNLSDMNISLTKHRRKVSAKCNSENVYWKIGKTPKRGFLLLRFYNESLSPKKVIVNLET